MTTSTPAKLRRSRAGFTLIELLTVIAIIGILAAIIIPTVGKVRQTARKAVCASNLRQIGMAINAFAADNKDKLPGNDSGLYGQVSPIYYDSGKYDLVFHLKSYLGAKVRNDMDASPVMSCPAGQPMLTENQKASYQLSRDTLLKNGTIGKPFGMDWNTGSASRPNPRKLTDIANPTRSVSLYDLDRPMSQLLGTDRPGAPQTPAHGSSRNFLYFDGHVASVSLDTDPRDTLNGS